MEELVFQPNKHTRVALYGLSGIGYVFREIPELGKDFDSSSSWLLALVNVVHVVC